MTIKLMLLKSGEDVIADVSEMLMGEGEKRTVIGYRLDKHCVIRMVKPNVTETNGNAKKAGFEVSLFPWIPLSKETNIPIPADGLITMVEPVYKLKEMYQEDIVNYGNENNTTDN